MQDLWQILRAHKRSSAELQDLQAQRLRRTVVEAVRQVPYYRELFQRAGLRPEDIRTVADLPALPETTKEDLVRAASAAVASGVDPKRCSRRNTSGSTGRPLQLLFTPGEQARERLLIFRALWLAGLRPTDKLAVVSAIGSHVKRAYQRFGLFRSRNISRFQTVDAQLRELQDYRPDALWAYATVVRELLYPIDDQMSRIIQPRVVITAGEIFDPHVRERLLSSLDVELLELYGSTEVGVIGIGCRQGAGLHIFSDQVVLETMDDLEIDGRPAGRVVVSCITPRAMPLLRYQIGDYFELPRGSCGCGLPFPRIGRPLGRLADLIHVPSGRILSPANCDAFLGSRAVQQYRFIHERDGSIHVQIRLRHGPEEIRIEHLRERIAAYLGDSVPFNVDIVERFPEQSIKFRTFVSRFNRQGS